MTITPQQRDEIRKLKRMRTTGVPPPYGYIVRCAIEEAVEIVTREPHALGQRTRERIGARLLKMAAGYFG